MDEEPDLFLIYLLVMLALNSSLSTAVILEPEQQQVIQAG
jgi:hypothetical protein